MVCWPRICVAGLSAASNVFFATCMEETLGIFVVFVGSFLGLSQAQAHTLPKAWRCCLFGCICLKRVMPPCVT